LYVVKRNHQASLRSNMIIKRYKNYYQASPGPDIIIKVMMKIMIIKRVRDLTW